MIASLPTPPRAFRAFLVAAFAALAFALLAASAQAQSNVLWDFGPTGAPLATPSSGLPADVTDGTVSHGNNNGTTALLTTVSVSSGYAGATGQHNAGAAARIGAYNPATSAYFQFSLAPDAGKQLTLSALRFGSRRTATGPQAYAIYTSVDGFAAPIATGAFALNTNWALHTPAIASVTGATSTPVTVRIFGFNGTGSPGAGTANWRIDDLQVTVSTAGGGPVAPAVISTSPADGAALVPVNTSIAITFNQPVTVQSGAFAINGSVSGIHSANVTGGPVTYTLTPFAPFLNGETVTVTAFASQIADQATGLLHPASDYAFDFTAVPATPLRKIHEVQGAGASSPLVGQDVTVRGVVTATFPGAAGLNGFFVQEEDADQDNNPATSEGIFVYDAAGSAANVTVGSLVAVSGRVTEFNGLTELTAPLSVSLEGTAPLPSAVSISLPVAALSDLEAYEGMRVILPQTLFVTETYTLGRYGEVVVSSGRPLPIPTNVAAPGAPALAQAAANERNRLVIDDGRTPSNPDPTPYLFGTTAENKTLRIGDTVTTLEGVLTYQFDAYTVQPTAAPVFVRANPRTLPPAPRRTLRVASANVLNFFNGNGAGGGFPTSRGADSAAEFARQKAHLVANLNALNADIIGLIEIENDGFGGTSAIRELVNALNAALPASSAFAVVDLGSPVGTDAIACGFIYKPSRVTLVGTAVNHDSVFSRPPVAATFAAGNGEKFTVCVNHFKSKGSPPSSGVNTDQGDGQGAWNVLRTQQSSALTAWLATNPTGTVDPDTLIMGDLNAYAKEDPVTVVKNAGYVNVLETIEGDGGYSYVFDGEVGHLDHLLATNSLWRQVTGAFAWHSNSAEPIHLDYNLENKSAAQQAVNNGPANNGATPWRASDHDPIVIDIKPGAPVR